MTKFPNLHPRSFQNELWVSSVLKYRDAVGPPHSLCWAFCKLLWFRNEYSSALGSLLMLFFQICLFYLFFWEIFFFQLFFLLLNLFILTLFFSISKSSFLQQPLVVPRTQCHLWSLGIYCLKLLGCFPAVCAINLNSFFFLLVSVFLFRVKGSPQICVA